MRYISNLNNNTVKELKKIVKNGTTLQIRQRAHAILLSNDGITIKEICKIFDKSSRTLYRWFDRFKEEQIDKLADEKGRGRKAALNEDDIENVKKLISINSIKETCNILNNEPNRVKKVSPQILKRYLKKYKI
jgi:transposase